MKRQVLNNYLTICHWYNFEFHLFQPQRSMKCPPWRSENLNRSRRKCRITSRITETIIKRQVPKTHKWNESTPWNDVIRVHLVANDMNFHNKQIKINSLDHHPTESGHHEILRENCCRNTESLWDKKESRVFVCFNPPFLRIT